MLGGYRQFDATKQSRRDRRNTMDHKDRKPEIEKNSEHGGTFLWKAIASSRSSTKGLAQKRVRFNNSENSEQVLETIVYQNDQSEEEEQNRWFTAMEFAAFKHDCKLLARDLRQTVHVEQFGVVYAAAKHGNNLKSIAAERSRLCASACRGLERLVFKELGMDAQTVRSAVLMAQAENQCQQSIAACSRSYSKRARNLARILGHGDAAYVRACRRIEEESEQSKKQVMTN